MRTDDPELHERLKNLRVWRSEISEMVSRVVHLGALRPVPPESVIKQSPPPKGIGENGMDALTFFEANQDKYASRVVNWYAREDVGSWAFSLKDDGKRFETLMTRGNLSAPLNRVGQGLGQVFPVVVQRSRFGEGFIEIIEEPESHLHVSAHGALADMFIPDPEHLEGLVLTETHSEMFLLRLRLRVAEGVLFPNNLAIYWVEDEEQSSYMSRIQVTTSGELENWPDEVFLEDYEELLALRNAMAGNVRDEES